MAELKTRKTAASVDAFLRSVPDPEQREDAKRLLKLMREVTGEKPRMWGSSIVGFGDRRYKYATGRDVDWFAAGFSPRKGNLSLYLGVSLDAHAALLKRLGKHKTGKGCVYIKRLEDVDLDVVRQLVRTSVAHMPGD
jgi:uncharacterized protein DUF1801